MKKNIIHKLGYQKHLWFAFFTPIFFLFGYWLFEDNKYLKNFAIIIERDIFQTLFPGYLAIEILIIFIGLVVPFIILSKIKCPNCQVRIVLHFLNRSKKFKGMNSPFTSTHCPNCGYEP